MTHPVAVPDAVAYLSATGWQDTGHTWRGGGIWVHDDVQVLVPSNASVRDYSERMRDVVRTVAVVEDRPYDDVLRSLQRPLDDEITYGPEQEMSLESGVESLRSLRTLLSEAARTVVEGPHHRFPGPEPRVVRDLVGSAALGSRVLPYVGFSLFLPSTGAGELSGREVATQLHDVAAAAARGAREEDPDAIVRAVLLGVSTGSCAALARLDVPDGGRFELGFRWSTAAGAVSPSRVEFPPGSSPVLRAAERRLSRNAVHGSATAQGVVDGLHDEPGSRNRWRARIRGEVLPDHDSVRGRVLWVRFSGQTTYDRAVEAYHQAQHIRLVGELTSRDGRIELVIGEDGWGT